MGSDEDLWPAVSRENTREAGESSPEPGQHHLEMTMKLSSCSRSLTLLLACGLAARLVAADAQPSPAPRHVGAPLAEHAVTQRAFTGIPSLAVAAGGRLWAAWYAGVTPGEDSNNYVVLSTSGDGGEHWTEVLTVDPDGEGPLRTFDPQLWVNPHGRLMLTWSQMDKSRRDKQLGLWYIETKSPDAERPRWTAPRRLTDGVMMGKPIVLASGAWGLPVSRWREHDESAQLIVSTDGGSTWIRRGGCNVPLADRQYDEHMFVERRDGSLWLLVRTKYGIGESLSFDQGKTWPELQPSAILHTPSRFFIRRLSSGNILLVKHGPLDIATSRSHLTAYLSEDDGRSWKGGLMLDERLGVSYPDGQQTADGLIRIVYDFNRTSDRQILMASFREEDVRAGQPVSSAVRLRQLVSQASGGREKPKVAGIPVKPNRDGEPLRRDRPGRLGMTGIDPQPLRTGAKLFSDRSYLAAEVPPALAAAQFLPIAMDGRKLITCLEAGTVWFLSPTQDRNRDSQAQALMDQGFEKVALPEIPLFHPASSTNYCTLYQKDCRAGETLLIGQWAVPLFPAE